MSASNNVVYDNFFLSNEIEDQFSSHLDLLTFCNIDRSLVGTAGMKRVIHVYSATDGTEKLAMGYGNTKTIEVGYKSKEYEILLAQNEFDYYDEQAMKDPMLVPVGMKHAGTDMFNTVNADIYAEFKKTPQVVVVETFNFDSFADADSVLNLENLEGVQRFAFVSPDDVAALRKKLKDTLQYVEAFAKNGYIGTVAGCNIYTKKDADKGTIVFGTKDAVTYFDKVGVEVEQVGKNNRAKGEANVRLNSIFSRKYYLAALTDETKAVKIIMGEAAATEDATVSSAKTYYKKNGNGYIAVTPEEGDNPATEGWYEITPTNP